MDPGYHGRGYPGARVIAEIHALAELIEAEIKGLRAPEHARALEPIVRKVTRLMARYFRRQGRLMVSAVTMKEAEADVVDAWMISVSPLALSIAANDAIRYEALIELAIIKAETQLSAQLDSMALIPETKMSQYLKSNSLSKLTGTLAETTKQKLRDAITLAIRSGGTADDIVGAIKATVKEFSSVRAELIAQTEVNNAYNFGRTELARSAGFTEKRWITESGNPCAICILNEAEGYIGIDQTFLSGDQRPTAHPRCYCSLDFRQVTL